MTHSVKLLFLSLLALLVAVAPLLACDACSSVPITRQGLADPGQGLFAGIATQFIHHETLQSPNGEVANDLNQYLDTSITSVTLGYRMSPRWSFLVNAPFIHRSWQRSAEGGGTQSGQIDGLGDISVITDVSILEPHQHEKSAGCNHPHFGLHGQFGLKLPTGDASMLREEEEEFGEIPDPADPPEVIHGDDLALGSGSVDVIVGASAHWEWRDWLATAQLQYNIRSEGRFHYRYSNDLTWLATFGRYLTRQMDWNLALRLVASGSTKGKNEIYDQVIEGDAAITMFFLGPQVTVHIKERLSLDLAVDLPVVTDVTEAHIVPDYRLRAAMSWQF